MNPTDTMGLIERLRLIARPGVNDVTGGEYKNACSEAAKALEALASQSPSADVEAVAKAVRISPLSTMRKVRDLATSPYPDDDRVKVPIRFGDIRWIDHALRAAEQVIADLRTVGDDYPGSSCQQWCRERADLAQAAIAAISLPRGEIEALRAALDEMIELARPNVYPQPDKPDSPYAKLERARLLLASIQKVPLDSDDGWIPWAGGECPVEPGTNISIMHRPYFDSPNEPTTERTSDVRFPEGLRWSHQGSAGDIIAYRLIPAPPRIEQGDV